MLRYVCGYNNLLVYRSIQTEKKVVIHMGAIHRPTVRNTHARNVGRLFALAGLLGGIGVSLLAVRYPQGMLRPNWEALVVNLTIINAILVGTSGIMAGGSLYNQGSYRLSWACNCIGYAALGSFIGSVIGTWA